MSITPTAEAGFSHHVLVDFENISELELGRLEGRSAHLTLFLGKAQTRLDLVLVEQIQRLPLQVALVRLAGSGRNALDLTLSCHLGRALERAPQAQFSVLSRDKDFDPMIEHLNLSGFRVLRCEKFSELPFLPKSKGAATTKPRRGKRVPVDVEKVPVVGTAPEALAPRDGERLEKLCNRLRRQLGPRPRSLARLLAHINTSFGGKLSEAEQLARLEHLKRRGILRIDGQGGVSYAPAD